MLKLISPTFEDIKTWYQLKEYSKEDIAWYVDMEVIDKGICNYYRRKVSRKSRVIGYNLMAF